MSGMCENMKHADEHYDTIVTLKCDSARNAVIYHQLLLQINSVRPICQLKSHNCTGGSNLQWGAIAQTKWHHSLRLHF